jgi:hypothetical protein
MIEMNREELLDKTRDERARLDAAVSRTSDEALLREPSSPDAWSGKDQLAHIAAWHRVALSRITGARPEGIADVADGGYTTETIDEVNERFHRRDRDLSLADVRAEYEDSYVELVAAIEGMSEADLAGHWLAGHPERGTYAEMLGSNTYEHYEEHIPLLEALAGE